MIANEAEDGAATRRAYSVPAAEKTLDILEFMVRQPAGMTITELAVGLGRSVHEVYRIILVLEARGYLYRPAQSDRYRVSLKIFEMAHEMSSVRQLTDAALPVMQTLAPATMQSCHLAVLSDRDALIVLQIDSPLPMRYSVMLGAKFQFEETSSGVVVFAFSPPEQRETLLSKLEAEGRDRADIESIRLRAEAIAADGYEVRTSLAVGGVTNISVPVFDYLGHVVAALTVPYMPQRAALVPLDAVVGQVIQAGRAISIELGAANRLPPLPPQ
ncbi:IclR family transcriptional regulator [Arsenicitalea aurantiaca]|nr:IclR family transcriptional regulator [Arsenicitalea aurantiaca]